MQSIKEIFSINTAEALNAARDQFEAEINERVQQLVDKLNQNILSSDVASIEQHMAYVESWRARLVRYLSFASAFTDHAKDSTFLVSKWTSGNGIEDATDAPKKLSETERDAIRRKLAGGFAALQTYLEGLIDCVDSRVNLAKKVLGIEVDAPHKKAV